MAAEVNSPKHQGVAVDHPAIVDAVQNMVKQGKKTEEIVRVVGMPAEVVNAVRDRLKVDKK